MVILAIQDTINSVKSFDKKHFEEILTMLDESKIDKQIDLPRGLIVYRKKDYLLFTRQVISDSSAEYEYELAEDLDIDIPEIKKVFKSRTLSVEEFEIGRA